jgi:hypothetical protein
VLGIKRLQDIAQVKPVLFSFLGWEKIPEGLEEIGRRGNKKDFGNLR